MKNKKFYAVKIGRKTGIFNTWEDCQKQVLNFKNASFKSFSTLEDAKKFLCENIENIENNNILDKEKFDFKNIKETEALAFVDGSYKKGTLEYGYGGVIILNDGEIEFSKKGKDKEVLKSRNVTGELFASVFAISEAIRLKKKKITIFYDYEGISSWADGKWKCNIPLTIGYKEKIDSLRKEIEICFVKVKAHSGDIYNERADFLAKKSLGIKK